jgi:hypothetical protein
MIQKRQKHENAGNETREEQAVGITITIIITITIKITITITINITITITITLSKGNRAAQSRAQPIADRPARTQRCGSTSLACAD